MFKISWPTGASAHKPRTKFAYIRVRHAPSPDYESVEKTGDFKENRNTIRIMQQMGKMQAEYLILCLKEIKREITIFFILLEMPGLT